MKPIGDIILARRFKFNFHMPMGDDTPNSNRFGYIWLILRTPGIGRAKRYKEQILHIFASLEVSKAKFSLFASTRLGKSRHLYDLKNGKQLVNASGDQWWVWFNAGHLLTASPSRA